MAKKTPLPEPIRILPRAEYPAAITTRPGGYTSEIRFAATTPLGLYYVEYMGAGHFQAYFLPRRARSRSQQVGGASSLQGAYERILDHQDRLLHPDAPRVTGQHGPVSVFSLGKRIGPRPTSQLEEEIRRVCAAP